MMFFVDEIYSAQIEIKKSKFLSFLLPQSEFKNFYEKLKIDHPKAVHFVYSYRFLNNFNQIVENQSDDGEPKNSSGIPSLNALRGADLIDTAAIVVRYFGGIKLGVGGLVRAYSNATNEAILAANLKEFFIKKEFEIFVPFNFIARFDYFCQKQNFEIFKDFINDGAIFKLFLTEKQSEILQNFTKQHQNFGLKFQNF